MTQDFVHRPTIKSVAMQRMEHRLGRSLEDYFHETYVVGELTMQAIARDLDVNVGTVSRWMAAVGIDARRPGTRRQAV